MGEQIKIKVWIRTNKVGSKCEDTIEFDKEDWESMSDDEKEEVCRDTAFNMGDWGFEEIG